MFMYFWCSASIKILGNLFDSGLESWSPATSQKPCYTNFKKKSTFLRKQALKN